MLTILRYNKNFQVKYGVQINSINGIAHGLKLSGLLKKDKLFIPTKFQKKKHMKKEIIAFMIMMCIVVFLEMNI